MCDDALESRRELRFRQLGTRSPACRTLGCNETDPLALVGCHPGIRCYECDRNARGTLWVERQHPAGQANHPGTVAMLGNDHRVIDALKNDWPRDTLRNPDGSPLLRAAACLRGWIDTLRVMLDRTLGWIPAFLEALHTALVTLHGADWWHELSLPAAPA